MVTHLMNEQTLCHDLTVIDAVKDYNRSILQGALASADDADSAPLVIAQSLPIPPHPGGPNKYSTCSSASPTILSLAPRPVT